MSYDKLNEKIMDMQDEIIKAVQGCVQIDSVKAAPEELPTEKAAVQLWITL